MAVPTVISKLADVAVLSPLAVASNVYPVPTLSIEISLNVASPLTAATTNVPDSVPLDGLLLIANVILSVAVGTRFPPASSTWTLIAGETDTVAAVFTGSTPKASCVAAPTVMSKLVDVAVPSPPAVASNV